MEFTIPVKVSSLSFPYANGAATAGAHDLGLEVRMRTRLTPGGVRILCDDGPANLESMRVALMALSGVPIVHGRHRWAVLGDMEQSGIDDSADHHTMGRFCAEHRIDRLVGVGSLAMQFAVGAIEQGMDEENVLASRTPALALQALKEMANAGDVVLVKGAECMEEIIEGMCSD